MLASMRRSELLTVTVFCPHFERPVGASRNAANDRLVDCTSKHECAREERDERGVTVIIHPVGCPVFRVPG
jgi:hypothetical protein